MVFPCEHLVWLPYPTGAAIPGSRAVDVRRFSTAGGDPNDGLVPPLPVELVEAFDPLAL
jgi:hypothetical protein